MPDIIHLLPDSLANQIAAGEVVQRPASVVKELLENSIDAKSTYIHLIIKDAGKQLIQVIDNGLGMSERDARMCLERHATSKINKTEDLFAIRTLGFRGEAMASIAAVAQVEIKTRKEDDEVGSLIKVEGSEIKTQEPISCEKGTSICVKNLFFNVPARRNFLKSNQVEMRHIMDEFLRVSLSYPNVGMSLFHNDAELLNLPAEKLSHRIVGVFGKNYKEQLIPCQEETEMVKVHGYIGKPENSKRSRGEQFFFVNKRFIKNGYLHHAVMNAYEELLGEESFPFYVIFIDIDPKHIDINVHPTKTEIKFDDEKTVYFIILAAVKKALATHNITPSLDFDLNVNFGELRSNGLNLHNEEKDSNPYFKEFKNSTSTKTPLEKANLENWQSLYSGLEKKEINLSNSNQTEPSFENKNYHPPLENNLLSSENPSTFQLHNQYIVAQVKSGMVILDQQAAHERILYEKYLSQLQNKYGASQQFLFPQTMELSLVDYALFLEIEEEIRALGFMISIFGKNSVVINGIPADVANGNEKGLFEGLIEQFKAYKTELKLEKRENLARSLAKRSAIKPGTRLSIIEMNTLVDQLFACQVPNYAPNGNLTIVLMDMAKIAKLFNKD